MVSDPLHFFILHNHTPITKLTTPFTKTTERVPPYISSIPPTMSKKNPLVRGGFPAPTKEWYENRNQAGNPQPFATYKNSHIFLGFNITPNQFAAIEERIMGLLRVNELYKESFGSYSTTIKHWSILECLAAEFPFLFSEQVPGWWAYDALKGWIKKDATWMKTNQGATKADRRLKSHAGGPPQKKLKVAGMVLLKHCHFMVSVRGEAGSATIVPLVDLLLEGKRPDDGVTDLQAWDLKSALLFSALAGDIEFEAHDMLVYTITGVAGEKIDVLITNDTHLRNAAMCLRTPGNTALFLEVIRSVSVPALFKL